MTVWLFVEPAWSALNNHKNVARRICGHIKLKPWWENCFSVYLLVTPCKARAARAKRITDTPHQRCPMVGRYPRLVSKSLSSRATRYIHCRPSPSPTVNTCAVCAVLAFSWPSRCPHFGGITCLTLLVWYGYLNLLHYSPLSNKPCVLGVLIPVSMTKAILRRRKPLGT